MRDLRQLLETRQEEVVPSPGAYDRLLGLRRRRERNRRIGAGVVALLMIAAGAAAVAGIAGIGSGRSPEPATSIDSTNVQSLRLDWWSTVSPDHVSPPAAGDGMVFVVSDRLYAFAGTCASPTCEPLWTADLGGGEWSAPVVSSDVVLVAGDAVLAFPVSCSAGAGGCRPLWRSPRLSTGRWSAPAVAGGVVYAADARGLFAFPEHCASHVCRPLWRGPASGGFAAPAVADGMVYVAGTGGLSAFRRSCPTRTCSPVWTAPGADRFFQPVAGEGIVVALEHGTEIAAYASDCDSSGGACRPRWTWDAPGGVAPTGVALSDRFVFVSGAGLFALPLHCEAVAGGCGPAWSGTGITRPAAPTVAGDLVFVSKSRAEAFPIACATSTCGPVWTSGPLSPRSSLSTAAISGGTLALTSGDGRVFALAASRR